MNNQKKTTSGFRKKYLRYTMGLLLLALLLSCAGVWIYMRGNMRAVLTDKYAFLNEKAGLALDNLFRQSDKAMEECILNNLVQESLKEAPLEEVEKNSLSKYFAYLDLDYISEYCYADNKQNLYTRSYSKIPYRDFERSGLIDRLGESYAATVWFVTADTLFGTQRPSLFIGRKVHSLHYAHTPGYLFFRMEEDFFDSLREGDSAAAAEVAGGILDEQGEVFTAWYPASFSMTEQLEQQLFEFAMAGSAGTVAESVRVPGGILFLYKQEQTGFSVFTIVPEQVLNQGTSRLVLVLLAIYFLVAAAAVLLSIYFSNRLTRPIRTLSRAMTEFDGNDFTGLVHLNTHTELDQIGNAYNKMLENIRMLLEEIRDQQRELRTSELNMLISQINPHFLYNTLDTIYMLARINQEETTMKMIQALSRYLRLSLSKGSDIVTVEDELENVKSYLQIQQIRNENLFTYTVDCLVEPETTWVLKLILQPLVENAIKHGFCEIYEGGEIRIGIDRVNGFLRLVVFNSGTPMPKELAERINALNDKPLSEAKNCFPDKRKGYGVANVLTRLRLKYGDAVRFTYQPDADGTTCTILIPGEGEQHEE